MTLSKHMADNRRQYSSCDDSSPERTANVLDLETHRWLRRSLLLTSHDIETIDLKLAAEAGLLDKRHRS